MKNKNKFLVILMVFGNLLYLQAAEGGSQEKPTVPPFRHSLGKILGDDSCGREQLAPIERKALVQYMQKIIFGFQPVVVPGAKYSHRSLDEDILETSKKFLFDTHFTDPANIKRWRKVMLGKVIKNFKTMSSSPLEEQQAFLEKYYKILKNLFESLSLIKENDDGGYWVVRTCEIFTCPLVSVSANVEDQPTAPVKMPNGMTLLTPSSSPTKAASVYSSFEQLLRGDGHSKIAQMMREAKMLEQEIHQARILANVKKTTKTTERKEEEMIKSFMKNAFSKQKQKKY